ncbi:hypothetical protein [Deinococcus pimensis]|uniref:hypothetical protein n=1 Tax=Deinococcus pimensis TaxID=309888 RepID=UPI00047FCA72|nr:hypothetical protein [Deinococcus pimensis]
MPHPSTLAACTALVLATTSPATGAPLSFELPSNLSGYSGFCVNVGSPDPGVDTRSVERVVIQELQARQLRAQPMGTGTCEPINLKTGRADARLVLSVELTPLTRRGEYLGVIRVNDPHLLVKQHTGRTKTYDAVLWMYAEHLTVKLDAPTAWRSAARSLASAWSLSRLQR